MKKGSTAIPVQKRSNRFAPSRSFKKRINQRRTVVGEKEEVLINNPSTLLFQDIYFYCELHQEEFLKKKMSFSSRRRNYLLTPHRRDGLIEWYVFCLFCWLVGWLVGWFPLLYSLFSCWR